MIEVAIMIEGQNGLTWPRWQKIVAAVEDLGFAGLYRSDHYTNANPPDKESLELWVSLTWLASHTQRIEFGPLVSPLSFRQPTMTARFATAVDDLSGGRLTLGLGAGWQEREHHNYSWELLDLERRFARFEEGLEIITGMLKSAVPLEFKGEFYRVHEGVLLPRPQRPSGPPILIGGNGPQRTLPLAARFANEWNAVYLSIPDFKERCARLDQLLLDTGRQPKQVKRSMMTGCIFGQSKKDVKAAVNQRTGGKRTPAELRQRGLIVGTPGEIVEQLSHWDQAGLQRIMLQWLDLDDLDGLAALAKGVLPQLS